MQFELTEKEEEELREYVDSVGEMYKQHKLPIGSELDIDDFIIQLKRAKEHIEGTYGDRLVPDSICLSVIMVDDYEDVYHEEYFVEYNITGFSEELYNERKAMLLNQKEQRYERYIELQAEFEGDK